MGNTKSDTWVFPLGANRLTNLASALAQTILFKPHRKFKKSYIVCLLGTNGKLWTKLVFSLLVNDLCVLLASL